MDFIGYFCKSCQILQTEPEEESQNSPFKPIFEEIWVYIKGILEEFSHLEKLSEASTRILKHSLRIVPQIFKENCLVQFLEIVILHFQSSPHSCFIYSVEFCLKEFSRDRQLDNIFQQALDVITEKCIRFLGTLEAAHNNPLVVEDLFSIWKRCLTCNKALVFNSRHLQDFLVVMTRCFGLEHSDAAHSHHKFIHDLLDVI